MMFALIDAKKAEVPIETACAALGVSVSGFYAWKNRPASRRQTDDMVLLAHIRAEFSTSNGTYGSPRMHAELTESGLAIGRHRVARLMSENGLKARQKTRFKRTTDSDHGGPVAANVLDRDFTADGPNQKWGVDISYVWTAEGWLYLCSSLLAQNRRLGDERQNEKRLGNGSPAESYHPPTTAAGLDPSFRSRQPVLLGRLPSYRSPPRLHRVDERSGQLLRQCHGRDRVQDHKIRADLADSIRDATAGRQRHWPIHRGLL